MNKSLVPEYSLVEESFYTQGIIVISGNIFSLIPNVYFLIRTFTYEPFQKRVLFKYMTMIMSFEYSFGNCMHILFCSYYFYHLNTHQMIHVNTCSKFQILDTDWNQIVIMTPIFFNIIRFYNVVLQKSTNIFAILITFVVAFGGLCYLTVPQLLEIDIYYIPKTGCPYEIYSSVPYFILVQYFNMFLLIFIPVFAFLINYIIYKLVIRQKQSVNKKESVLENRNLFRSIAIQSFYPFGCQLPGILLVLYTIIFRQTYNFLDNFLVFIYHFGQAFCIFFSLIVIKEFRNMIFKDFGIPTSTGVSKVSAFKTVTLVRTKK
uniref:G_PROTEIN_RECEP_F1_2 domain-containing protein n=1 Tax=Strongyloides papillosus TaxID=174720 RepID=A0A0N5BL96_STREA